MLRSVVMIEDTAFLDRLIALGIGPERALILRLIPLIFVAWADGHLDDRERDAILAAATKQGLAADDLAREVLGDWLERKPDDRIFEMWQDYVRRLWSCFTDDEQEQMRKNCFEATQAVARAAGGILGLASISAAERKVLDEIEATLG